MSTEEKIYIFLKECKIIEMQGIKKNKRKYENEWRTCRIKEEISVVLWLKSWRQTAGGNGLNPCIPALGQT